MLKLKFKISVLGFFVGASLLLVAPAFAADSPAYFYVDPTYDSARRTELQADLLFVTDHAYVYVEHDWWKTLTAVQADGYQQAIQNLSNEFNQRIYPLMTMELGSEWKPGIDNDERLTIFVTRLSEGVAGYFNSVDEISRSRIPNSNQREMLYLSVSFLSSDRLKAFLAHEFQHLITYNWKTQKQNLYEDTWLNEARSEYAPTLMGYDDSWDGSNLSRRVEEFENSPSDSLTEWKNNFADYGVANIFVQYLIDHYGKNILKLTLQNNGIGIPSVNSALATSGQTKTFSDIFTDWSVASYLNDCSVAPVNLYCFLNKNLPYSRLHVSLSLAKEGDSVSQSSLAKDWAAYWYQVDYMLASKVLKVSFSSGDSRAAFRLPYILVHNNGTKEVKEVVLQKTSTGENTTFYINGFGKDIVSAVFIPHNEYKTTGFSAEETGVPYRLDFSLVSSMPEEPALQPTEPVSPTVTKPDIPDGSLIRQQGDYKVYVIKGNYKRWILSPAIMGMYPHFLWTSVREVSASEFSYYQDAWLVRADGDTKVYEINGDGTKHWLNMTPDWFAQSGRKWDMVYVVNKQERDWYRTGAEVLR